MEQIDAAAVSQVLAGDCEAFRVLVDRHARTLHRLAFRLTGNDDDADDVVQEAFLRAYRQLDRFESRSSFGTWLYRIAVNCCHDLLRERRRRMERQESRPPAEIEVDVEFTATDPAADRLVFSAEVQQRISAALEMLTPHERTAFLLRHREELSIEEIGKVMGLKQSATKHSIFRAVQKLRRSLQPMMRPTG
jgi:RNA polymerase sigma-70 factor, ECF subfamily